MKQLQVPKPHEESSRTAGIVQDVDTNTPSNQDKIPKAITKQSGGKSEERQTPTRLVKPPPGIRNIKQKKTIVKVSQKPGKRSGSFANIRWRAL